MSFQNRNMRAEYLEEQKQNLPEVEIKETREKKCEGKKCVGFV